MRAERSAPVLAGIKARLDTDSVASHLLPSSPLAIAVKYSCTPSNPGRCAVTEWRG